MNAQPIESIDRKTTTDRKLLGQLALVTGASSGIGAATARALALEGAHVAIAARRIDRIEALAEEIKSSGGAATVIATDLADPNSARQMVEQAYAVKGRLDILVNNAGVMLVGPLLAAEPADLQRMIDVNLAGLVHAVHAALPLMVAQGGGHIVNVSSIAGRATSANFAVYCATKFGVAAFSEALRQEVSAHRIRVTTVEPGAVATELFQHIPHPQTKEWVGQYISSIEMLCPGDIAAGIVYATTQPERVNVNELLIRPLKQSAAF